MKLDAGTPVFVMAIHKTEPHSGFFAGLVEDRSLLGISLDTITPDELPNGVFVPWANVYSVLSFENKEALQQFWESYVDVT